MYGNPVDRTYNMNSSSDVKMVVNNFNDCPITKRYILASNIKKAFDHFGMKQPIVVEESNQILNFLKSDYVIARETYKVPDNEISEIDVDEMKYKTLKNVNDYLSSIELVSEANTNIPYETNVNPVTFPDTDLTKRIKQLCIRSDSTDIITNLSDMDIFKIKSKLMKDNSYDVKIINENDKSYVIMEDQTYMIGKLSDNEYLLLSDSEHKSVTINNENKKIKSIEEIKQGMS